MHLGAHMSIEGGVHRALERGASIGCEVVQVFTQNQVRWEAKPHSQENIRRFLELKVEFFEVLSHGSYLINLASPDQELHRKSVRGIEEELNRCGQLGIPFLIVHPGNHMGAGVATGIRTVASALSSVCGNHPNTDTSVLLETTAGSGTAIGSRFEQLRDILDLTGDIESRIGICLDTCHCFAAGYDMRTEKLYGQLMRELDRRVGLHKLKAIHLNDSKGALGSKVDRHEHIGRGRIGAKGFRHLLADRSLRDRPMCLETPKGKDMREDIENLAVLRSLLQMPFGGRQASTRNGDAVTEPQNRC